MNCGEWAHIHDSPGGAAETTSGQWDLLSPAVNASILDCAPASSGLFWWLANPRATSVQIQVQQERGSISVLVFPGWPAGAFWRGSPQSSLTSEPGRPAVEGWMAELWVVWGWVRPEWIQRRDECQGRTQAPTQRAPWLPALSTH